MKTADIIEDREKESEILRQAFEMARYDSNFDCKKFELVKSDLTEKLFNDEVI